MQARDIATMFGVRKATVRMWMSKRGLPYRSWDLGRYVVRVALSTELFDWMDQKLHKPGDGSRADRRMTRHQVGGRNAAKQRTLNHAARALLDAQRTIDPDDTTHS